MKNSDPLKFVKTRADKVSHIHQIDAKKCEACEKKPCTVFCPSQVFAWEEDALGIDYARCVECGACLRGCPYANVHWDYPRPGYGISHEF